MAAMSAPAFTDCSSCWNCASWPMNCVPSLGLMGSWLRNCATRSCRNMFLLTGMLGAAAAVPEVGGVLLDEDIPGVMDFAPDQPLTYPATSPSIYDCGYPWV